MQARLKVLHDKANVKQVKLLPVTLIGRSTDCNLKIASSQVSRNHCRITLAEDTVFVEDLGSANGTLVDGQLIPAHQPTAIAPGAHLIVGPAEFLIDYVAPTSTTMVLSRSGGPPPQELPSTEMIFPAPPPTIAPLPPDVAAVAVPPAAIAATSIASKPVAAAAVNGAIAVEIAPAQIPAPVETAPAEIPAASVPVAAAPVEPATVFVPSVPAVAAMESTAPPAAPDFDPEATLADFGLGQAEHVAESPDADDTTMFDFGESTGEQEPAPAQPDVAPKKGALKSLFSLFGRKDRPATASSAESAAPATASPSVFLPTVDTQSVEATEEQTSPPDLFVFGTVDPAAAAGDTVHVEGQAAPDTESDEDGGFQQFLQQL